MAVPTAVAGGPGLWLLALCAVVGVLVGVVGIFVVIDKRKKAREQAILAALPGSADDRNLFIEKRERALEELPAKYVAKNFRMFLDDHMAEVCDGDSVFATADPKVVRKVMMSKVHAAKRHPRYGLVRLIPYADGILFMEGKVWKRHQSALLPVFQSQNWGPYAERMHNVVKHEVASWATGDQVDVVTFVRQVSLKVLFEAGFGVDVSESPTPEGQALYAAVKEYDEKAAFQDESHMNKLVAFFMGMYKCWADGKRVLRAARALLEARKASSDGTATGNRVQLPIVRSAASSAMDSEERALLVGDRVDGESAAASKPQLHASAARPKMTTNFLDRMDEAGFSDAELTGEITHLKGAHRAVGMMSGFGLFELAQSPEWSNRLREEFDAVLEAAGRTYVAREDLPKLPVLMAVLKETTRKHAISLGVLRMTAEDLEVPVGDKVLALPAGMTVLVLLHSLHHDPEFWENPREFNPGRWLDQDPSTGCYKPKNDFRPKVPFSYIPFLEGGRQCLGRKLVELEFATTLHVVLSAADISVPPGYTYRIKPDFYPVAEDPLTFNVTLR